MKKSIALIALCAVTAVCLCTSQIGAHTGWFASVRSLEGNKEQRVNTSSNENFVEGRILVKFRNEESVTEVNRRITRVGLRSVSRIPNIGVHMVELPQKGMERGVVKYLNGLAEVEFAELD